jgi:hypothetical protein
MYQGGNQQFASPTEALTHISEQAWSDYTKADYTIEQWHSACLIHIHDGEPTSKSQCKLPVKTPNGALNRNGVHAAAAALAGARGGLKGVSADQKQKAANALKRYYAQLDEEPPESLSHYGVKGMRWGYRKQDDTSVQDIQGNPLRGALRTKGTLEKHTGRAGFTPRTEVRVALLGPGAAFDPKVRSEFKEADRLVKVGKAEAKRNTEQKQRLLEPGTPAFQQRVERITRTDRPQALSPQRDQSGRVGAQAPRIHQEKHGLSREQKMLVAFGAVSVAAAGYYAYNRYQGGKMPGLDLKKIRQEEQALANLKLPAHWDVRGLKDGPISKQNMGDLAGGEFNARIHDARNLVINTSRGYADILPKNGFDNPFAAEQHASVTRVLEEMRNKYPAIRNMNIEVIPMSKVPGVGTSAHMAVMSMRAGEARVVYNDIMDAPDAAMIRANRKFLPGLGSKDYVAYHEMGHLLAAAHGDIPPAFDLLKGNASPSLWRTWEKADPLLHKRMFAKHGFTFKELSKLSQYAATEPAEAMAELAGHVFQPDMRKRLTPDQLRRAEAMFNEMGGLTG